PAGRGKTRGQTDLSTGRSSILLVPVSWSGTDSSVPGFFRVLLVLFLAGCAAPPRAEQPKPDPTREAGYLAAVEQLAELNREAQDLLKRGRADDAAAAITKGQPLQAQLLAAPQPTLAAMEAVSDLDELYARMLLSNHHDGWARMLFQKNIVRWK